MLVQISTRYKVIFRYSVVKVYLLYHTSVCILCVNVDVFVREMFAQQTNNITRFLVGTLLCRLYRLFLFLFTFFVYCFKCTLFITYTTIFIHTNTYIYTPWDIYTYICLDICMYVLFTLLDIYVYVCKKSTIVILNMCIVLITVQQYVWALQEIDQ